MIDKEENKNLISINYEAKCEDMQNYIFKINKEKNILKEQVKTLIETIKILCEVSNE